jgi:hypothetical protein
MQTEQLTQQLSIPISPGLAPISTNTNATIGPIDMLKYNRVMAHVQLGVVGTASNVQAFFQGCNTNTGSFANISGANTLTLSTTNAEGTLELRGDQLAVNTGFRFVQLNLTLNGANASLLSAQVFGGQGPYKPQSQYDNTALAGNRLVM